MSRRRAARGAAGAQRVAVGVAESPLPSHLAAGPVVEVWAGPEYDGCAHKWRANEARRRWRRAVIAWALSSGWATPERPADLALELAVTTHPVWSDHERAR